VPAPRRLDRVAALALLQDSPEPVLQE